MRLAPALACFTLIIASSSTLFAGDKTWTHMGPSGGSIVGVAIDSSSPTTWYAAVDRGGLYKSTSNGDAWSAVAGAPPGKIGAVLADPAAADTLYVGVGNALHVSHDGAHTFEALGTFGDTVTGLVRDPSFKTRLYVLTANAGAYRTDDDLVFSSLPALLPFDPFVGDLAIDETNSNRLYMSTGFSILRSDDAGLTGVEGVDSPRGVTAIVIDPSDHSRVYASSTESSYEGVHVSVDEGITWTHLPGITAPVFDLAYVPGSPDTLYAALDPGGVWKSTDKGATWSSSNDGLPEPSVWTLAVASNGWFAAGGAHGGVFKRSGSGSWQTSSEGIDHSFVNGLALSGSRVYAATLGRGVLVTADQGKTWIAENQGLPGVNVGAVASHPSDPLVAYAGLAGAGVFISSDGGDHWTATTGAETADVRTIAVDPVEPARVYVGAFGGWISSAPPWFWRSEDGGHSWIPSTNGITDGRVTRAYVTEQPRALYVATDGGGLFKSVDNGLTFASVNEGAGEYGKFVLSIAQDRLNGALYEGQHGGGVAVSMDNAASWTFSDVGLTDFWIFAVATHAKVAGIVYAGTFDAGVSRSVNGAKHFGPLNKGLSDRKVTGLEMDPATLVLYASTEGDGIAWLNEADAVSGGTGGGGTGGTGGIGTGGSAGLGGAGGTSGAGGSLAPEGGLGDSGLGGSGIAGGAGAANATDAAEAGGQGCSCSSAGTRHAGAWTLWGALALLGLLRMRRDTWAA
ncbi:MAG: hypothetical protein HY898_15555 [Deltaproteobacteria bacterium]|nr:hypothetical protein [Deltaproteobacteria bacterium]